MKTKFILLFLGLLTFVISCNKDKDIAFGSNNESVVPFEFRNIKSEVDEYFKNNPDLFPDNIKPIIMWEKAVKVKNNIEVEVKLTNEEGMILFPKIKNDEYKNTYGKFLLRVDMNNLSNMYLYSILPESKGFFVYKDLTIESLHDPAFTGTVFISKMDLKPFVILKYHNGKIIGNSENLFQDENNNRKEIIKPRGYEIWCFTYTYEWGTLVGPASGGEFYQTEQGFTSTTICIYVWVDDGGINTTGGGNGDSEWNDSDFCDLYPWLCEDGGGGGSDGDDGDGDGKCNCTCEGTSNFHFSSIIVFELPKFFNIIPLGHVDYDLGITDGNCLDGTYSSFLVENLSSAPGVTVETKEQNKTIEKTDLIKACGHNQIQCGYRITHFAHVIMSAYAVGVPMYTESASTYRTFNLQ